jgi:hypothetical protein|eukprot:COSAG01_NODE_2001_length_8673_cov_22.568346_2_plen_54_part_00
MLPEYSRQNEMLSDGWLGGHWGGAELAVATSAATPGTLDPQSGSLSHWYNAGT